MKPHAFVLGVVLMSVSQQYTDAATYRYRQTGNWSQVTSGTDPGWGLNPNNSGAPGLGLPGSADDARINWGGNTVTVSSTVPTVNRVQIGVDESGIVIVANGGVLSALDDILAGNNNANATGTLTVQSGGQVNVGDILWAANNFSNGVINVQSGGLVTVASHLWWGVTGTATINISGVLNQTGGILGLGTSNASTASGGTATVSITNGGELNLNNISGAAGTPSIHAGSQIQISPGGLLTVKGDQIGSLNNYIAANEIVGVGGTLDVSYDSGSNLTSVMVVPEPSVAVLLGALPLLLSRRRRS